MDHPTPPTLLTVEDCRACRRCCTFYQDEVNYAPQFTTAEKTQVEAGFPDKGLRFTPSGRLWRIELQHVAAEKWQCPLYEPETARCLVQAIKPRLCRSWPLYLIRNSGGRVSVAYHTSCPPLSARPIASLRDHVNRYVIHQLIAEAREYPETINDVSEADCELCTIPEGIL